MRTNMLGFLDTAEPRPAIAMAVRRVLSSACKKASTFRTLPFSPQSLNGWKSVTRPSTEAG